MHEPDSGDDAGAGRLAVVLVVRDEQARLDEARARIAQTGNALARGELALCVLAGDPLDAAALPQLGLERADLAGERAEPRGHASCRWRSANHSRM